MFLPPRIERLWRNAAIQFHTATGKIRALRGSTSLGEPEWVDLSFSFDPDVSAKLERQILSQRRTLSSNSSYDFDPESIAATPYNQLVTPTASGLSLTLLKEFRIYNIGLFDIVVLAGADNIVLSPGKSVSSHAYQGQMFLTPEDGSFSTSDYGWTPILANVFDGSRIVQQIVDWIGGDGVKPSVNMYVGSTGYVTDIAQATDVRGGSGSGTIDLDARSAVLSLQGGATISNNRLIEWAETSAYRFLGTINTDSKGNILAHSIIWVDGSGGTYTPSILHPSGYYTRLVLFHQTSGKSATGNITRNAFGEILTEPLWVVTP